jgi:hypothetical protein
VTKEPLREALRGSGAEPLCGCCGWWNATLEGKHEIKFNIYLSDWARYYPYSMSVSFLGCNQTPFDKLCLDPSCCPCQAYGPCGVWGCNGPDFCKRTKTHMCRTCGDKNSNHRQKHCPTLSRPPVVLKVQATPLVSGPEAYASKGVGAYIVKKIGSDWHVLAQKRSASVKNPQVRTVIFYGPFRSIVGHTGSCARNLLFTF